MIPNVEQLEDKVVVIILNSGREILCRLWNSNQDNGYLTVENPRYITLNAATGQANMIVMTVTSNQNTVYLSTAAVLTVMEATPDVAAEYNKIIASELEDREAVEEAEDAGEADIV